MTVILRPGAAGDIVRLQEIERDAATLFHGWPGIDPAATDSVISLGDHLRSIDEGMSIVIEADGRIVGFAIGEMHDEDAYLRELDVARSHQRQGLGAQLVRAFIAAARARKARDIYLATFRTPPWNAPFYTRMGFTVVPREAYLPWMAELEASQAAFLDISTRLFMRLAS